MRHVQLVVLLTILLISACAKQTQKVVQSTDSIPANLFDAHEQLIAMLPDSIKEQMRSDKDSTFINYHFGLGMWMRNRWGLWRGSRLKNYFESLGIYHPDDMSGFILETFWYRIHDKPIPLEKLLKNAVWHSVMNRTASAFGDSLCPRDHERIEIQGFLERNTPQWKVIFYGFCESNHLWTYEYGHNLESPNRELRREIHMNEEVHRRKEEKHKQKFPVIIKLESMFSRLCFLSDSEMTTFPFDSLTELVVSYRSLFDSHMRGDYIPRMQNSTVFRAIDKIEIAADKDSKPLLTLLKLSMVSDEFPIVEHPHSNYFPVFAKCVLNNVQGFIHIWPSLSREEKSKAGSYLSFWSGKDLIKKLRAFAATSNDRQTRRLVKEILSSLDDVMINYREKTIFNSSP